MLLFLFTREEKNERTCTKQMLINIVFALGVFVLASPGEEYPPILGSMWAEDWRSCEECTVLEAVPPSFLHEGQNIR